MENFLSEELSSVKRYLFNETCVIFDMNKISHVDVATKSCVGLLN